MLLGQLLGCASCRDLSSGEHESLAVRGDKHAAWEQVLERRMGGGQMRVFGAGRWLWALVWATVMGEDRARGWGWVRGNRKQEGRRKQFGREWPRIMEEPGLRASWAALVHGIRGVWAGKNRLGLWESEEVV